MKYPYFLQFDTNSKKFKVDQNSKLTVSEEWKD